MEKLLADLNLILLISLRIGPVFAFAPPFTLLRIPGPVRLMVVLVISATLLGLARIGASATAAPNFILAALGELSLGIAIALALQLAFAMIAVVGRSLYVQSGFGLAFLIDPTTRAHTPLIGALFGYAAAAVFFATNGPHDVLAALALSFEAVPLGHAFQTSGVGTLIGFLGAVSVMSLGVAGLAMLILFMIDAVVAMLSRTLPQMNVLVLGFQVKSLAILFLLPATIALGLASMARIIRLAIEVMTGLA
jgi:flagellar biosynthesis protein FliR